MKTVQLSCTKTIKSDRIKKDHSEVGVANDFQLYKNVRPEAIKHLYVLFIALWKISIFTSICIYFVDIFSVIHWLPLGVECGTELNSDSFIENSRA